jgi:sugar lactone lactonase YvrE
VASVFATTNEANGLAFDQAGNLFATNGIPTDTLTKFTPGGVSSIFATGGGLSNPIGLAFDKSGNLFVASANNNTIYRFTPGGVESVFASGGILNDPATLAFDSAGNLFVGNEVPGASSIDKFTPGGVGSLFATTPGRPLALVFQPVPEPSSFVMFGGGVLGLLSYGWPRCRSPRA